MPGKGSHPSRGESRTPSSKPHSEHHGSTDRYRDHTKGATTVALHRACLFWARSAAAVNLGINTSLILCSPVMRSWASHRASQFPPLKSSGGGVRASHIRWHGPCERRNGQRLEKHLELRQPWKVMAVTTTTHPVPWETAPWHPCCVTLGALSLFP